MNTADPLIPGSGNLLPTAPHAARDAVSRRPPGSVQWRSRARDEWFGREGRSAVGTVRRLGADYLAIDSTGMLIGFFPSLSEAEASFSSLRNPRATRAAAMVAAGIAAVAVLVVVVGLVVLIL